MLKHVFTFRFFLSVTELKYILHGVCNKNADFINHNRYCFIQGCNVTSSSAAVG